MTLEDGKQRVKFKQRHLKTWGDGGESSRRSDICGTCPAEATAVSANESWQVGTMQAAGCESLIREKGYWVQLRRKMTLLMYGGVFFFGDSED